MISNSFDYSNNVMDSNIDYSDSINYGSLSNEEKNNIKDNNYKIFNYLKEMFDYVK